MKVLYIAKHSETSYLLVRPAKIRHLSFIKLALARKNLIKKYKLFTCLNADGSQP